MCVHKEESWWKTFRPVFGLAGFLVVGSVAGVGVAIAMQTEPVGVLRPIVSKDAGQLGNYGIWTFRGTSGQTHEVLVPCKTPLERNNGIWILEFKTRQGGFTHVANCG